MSLRVPLRWTHMYSKTCSSFRNPNSTVNWRVTIRLTSLIWARKPWRHFQAMLHWSCRARTLVKSYISKCLRQRAVRQRTHFFSAYLWTITQSPPSVVHRPDQRQWVRMNWASSWKPTRSPMSTRLQILTSPYTRTSQPKSRKWYNFSQQHQSDFDHHGWVSN